MKPRHFKIRTSQSQTEDQPRIRKGDQTHKNTILPIAQSQQLILNDDDNNYKSFFKMFKSIIDKEKGSRAQTENQYKMDLQPRDREIIIEPPSIFKDIIQEKELKKWIASVFKTVASAAFHYYSKNQMTFQQAKIFCSENIFKNITNLSRNYTLSAKELAIIDHHIEGGVLNYLGTKYPLTDSSNINKRLQEIIHQVDNIEALPNNYLHYSTVQFEYRDDGNYNDLIMRVINQFIDCIDRQASDQKTNYQEFEEFMAGTFEKVMDDDWMQKKEKQYILSSLRMTHQKSDINMSVKQNKLQGENVEDLKQKLRKRNEEREKYRTNVKQYTHYLIGRKIPEHSPKYTQKEIDSRNINIKNPTILRILTKWCEELWQKFSQVGYYTSRSESVKVWKGGNVNSLLQWMRKDIDEKLHLQKQEIIKFTKQIEENNYEMQSKILKMQLSMEDCDYVQQLQKACGKFSSKVVKNIHSYISAYLNRLIHGLMSVAKQFHTQHSLGNFSFWPSPPNLLTFRIGDLMRCKISSKEKEIIRIYKEIQRISKENPEKLKVIRIKNRLKKGTNDILINFKFNNLITCEVQLAVKGTTSDFIKCSNNFHHYLYQLQRSNFGPLTQLCSIWSNLDKRVQIYEQMIEQEKNYHKPADHICKKLNKKTTLKPYLRPFICNQCSIAYFHNIYLKPHIKCTNCQYYVCANCQIEKKADEAVIQQLIEDKEIRKLILQKIDKNEALPKYGVCIFLQSKVAKREYFMYRKYEKNLKDYIFGKKNGKLYEIETISTQKESKEFRRKHLIFQIKDFPSDIYRIQQEQVDIYMLTKIMKSNYKKQKQSISLMGELLTTEACRQILAPGSKSQKENVKNLFLTDNKLSQLPFDPEEFPNLAWLTLSRNEDISVAGIEKLPNLKNLILVSGNLQSIPEEVYQSVSLEDLSLTQNQIPRIQDKIGNLKKLRVMQFDTNAITFISPEIKHCKALISIKMESNYLTELPEEMFTLENLQTLLFNNNQLSSLSSSIGNLVKMKQLNIASNYNISELPGSITKLVNLQKLNISNSQISKLPDQFWKLEKLVQLNLSATQIRDIPPNFLYLTRLQKLQLGGLYEIKNLQTLGQLKSLKMLDLNNCNLTSLPHELKQLQNLQSLDISTNSLTYIDQLYFQKMTALTKLNICNNQLKQFPNLKKQKVLNFIQMSNNSITQIDNQHLVRCKHLESFNMTNNLLKQLPSCFREFNKLVTLDLKNNQLTSLLSDEVQEEVDHSEAIIWPKLTNLFLNYNQLTKIPKYLCRSPKLAQFYFSNNNVTVIPAQISQMKKLRQIQANYNQITEISQGLSPLQNLIGVYLSFNKVKCVPNFISKIPKLQAFYVDNCEVETIECVDWILEQQYTMTLGTLPELAYKIKHGRGRYQYDEAQNQNPVEDVPIEKQQNRQGEGLENQGSQKIETIE